MFISGFVLLGGSFEALALLQQPTGSYQGRAGRRLPFHLPSAGLGTVRVVFVSPRVLCSLSKARDRLWWVRESWTGLPEHPLPCLCPSLLQALDRDVQCCAFPGSHSSSWELFAGLVSENTDSIQAVGPSVQEPRQCWLCQQQEAVALHLLWFCSALGVVWVLVHPCAPPSLCSSIPVGNSGLFALMEGVLSSCFQ